MKLKLLLLLFVFTSGFVFIGTQTASALPCPDGSDGGSAIQIERGSCANHQTGGPEPDDAESGETGGPVADPNETNFDPNTEYDCAPGESVRDCVADNPIVSLINTVINIFSIIAGIAIVAGIVAGGIKYSASGGDPSKAASAQKMIGAAVGGLIAFIFLRAFIEFILP